MHVPVEISLEPGAFLPEYQTEGAAGMDLRLLEDVVLVPMERVLARTGVRIALPEGFEAQIRPRSGLALRHGIGMVNSPGTIDWDYRGEIGLILVNLGANVVKLARGERVAQMVVAPVARCQWKVVESLDATTRGESGFGSTGRS